MDGRIPTTPERSFQTTQATTAASLRESQPSAITAGQREPSPQAPGNGAVFGSRQALPEKPAAADRTPTSQNAEPSRVCSTSQGQSIEDLGSSLLEAFLGKAPQQARQATPATTETTSGREAAGRETSAARQAASPQPRKQANAAAGPGQATTTQLPPDKIYPPEMREILERARRGDRSVLPALKKAFDENPDWVELFGNLPEHARQTYLTVLAGSNLVAKEAIVRKYDQVRATLVGEGASPVECLLIDRICMDWLAIQQCDIETSSAQCENPSYQQRIKAAQQHLDRAHKRFCNALKTFATVKKLLRPTRSTLDLLQQPPDPTRSCGKRDNNPVSDGVPVLN
jgi:hypothetical protein